MDSAGSRICRKKVAGAAQHLMLGSHLLSKGEGEVGEQNGSCCHHIHFAQGLAYAGSAGQHRTASVGTWAWSPFLPGRNCPSFVSVAQNALLWEAAWCLWTCQTEIASTLAPLKGHARAFPRVCQAGTYLGPSLKGQYFLGRLWSREPMLSSSSVASDPSRFSLPSVYSAPACIAGHRHAECHQAALNAAPCGGQLTHPQTCKEQVVLLLLPGGAP